MIVNRPGATDDDESSEYARARAAADAVAAAAPVSPRVAIVLGSGLGKLADSVEDATTIPFTDIPHLAPTTVEGHAGRLVLGRLGDAPVAVLRGRLVDGVFQQGALTIALKVEPLEDGLPGQTIRIRNPKTNHELYGKVKNDQTILITL